MLHNYLINNFLKRLKGFKIIYTVKIQKIQIIRLMMDDYFEKFKEYKKKFGDKMFFMAMWSFFEIYGIKRNNIQTTIIEYSRILDCQIAKRGKYKEEPLEMAGFTVNKPLSKIRTLNY